mgnify:CR=1 FL=1
MEPVAPAAVATRQVTGQVPRQVTGPVPLVEDQPRRRHHTTIPRLLCVVGHASWLVLPIAVIVLARQGYIYFRFDDTLFIDERAQRVVVLLVLIGVFGYLIGWLWWTVAALLNARHKSRYTPWPGIAWAALVVQVGAVFALGIELDDEFARFALVCGVGLTIVGAHFWVLGSLRRAAGAVKAPQDPWSRMIILPIAGFAMGIVASFFLRWVGRPASIGLMVVGYLNSLWYVSSVYSALTSFDRACVGRMSIGQDDHALMHFRFNRG